MSAAAPATWGAEKIEGYGRKKRNFRLEKSAHRENINITAVLQHHRIDAQSKHAQDISYKYETERERLTGHGSPRDGVRGRVAGVPSRKHTRSRREDVHAGAVVGKGRPFIEPGGRSHRNCACGARRGVVAGITVVISGGNGDRHVLVLHSSYSIVDRSGNSSPEAHGSDAPLPGEWGACLGGPVRAVFCYLVHAGYDATV